MKLEDATLKGWRYTETQEGVAVHEKEWRRPDPVGMNAVAATWSRGGRAFFEVGGVFVAGGEQSFALGGEAAAKQSVIVKFVVGAEFGGE